MSDSTGTGEGTPDAPWVLTTPSGGSEFEDPEGELERRPVTALEVGQPLLHGGDDLLGPRHRLRVFGPGGDVVDHPNLSPKRLG